MRGFEESEFESRCSRAQNYMAEADLAALLLTTEPEVRYLSGFLTRFWESPTRPWFLILPANGKPVAVIPSIGKALMETTWITDIRCWTSPDLTDDGMTQLADALRELVPEGERIGLPDGHETHLRMPMADFDKLKTKLGKRSICGDEGIIRRLRMVKTPAEVAKIQFACKTAGRAFARVPEIASHGVPLEQIFREFQVLCLQEGADWVPYLAGGAGPDGYLDVISPATQEPVSSGDVLMLDTGLVFDGYFCDFDRNWSIGPASQKVRRAHQILIDATRAGMEMARPGALASDVYHAMNRVLSVGSNGTDTGRLGHGLGMSLTEWPSLIPDDHTVLEAGMVLTLEPSVVVEETEGRILVHEENVLITDTVPQYLSTPADQEIMTI